MSNYYTKLKTKNKNAPRAAYVPDTHTPEYRRQKQKEWEFRLNAEFQSLDPSKWNMAFCTLTYEDSHLPHIPKQLFKNDSDYQAIPCFSRKDIKAWINHVRQYFKYHNRFCEDRKIRFFIASEYGSVTHRPHYHAVLAWPNEVSYEKMHAVCTHYWENGFLFPRSPAGDKGMLPFEIVGDKSKALSYVSKYASKDVDFENVVRSLPLNRKMRLYNDIGSFHMQSKSLGFELIAGMDDARKREVFVHGISFQGDGEVYKIPLYIKNRIVFDNEYIYTKDGRRLVRRQASEFFKKYKKEMYEEKAKFYEKMFQECSTEAYFVSRGVEPARARLFDDAIAGYRFDTIVALGFDVFDSGVLGEYYLCYFGIDRDHCKAIHTHKDAVDQWFRRYNLKAADPNPADCITNDAHKALQGLFSMILGANTFCNLLETYKLECKERLNKRINDYFNNVLGGLINAVSPHSAI